MRILTVIVLLVVSFALGRYSLRFIPTLTKRNESPIIPPVDFSSMYSGQYKIVLFGDSQVQRVAWNELLNRCDIAGRGLRKDNSKGYLARIENVLKCKPSIVLLEVGSNDIEQHVPYDEFISNVSKIVDALRSRGIRVILFDICFVGKAYRNYAGFNRKVTEFNKGIDSISVAIKEPVINLNDQLCPNGYLKPEFAQVDGCHHLPAAYLVWKSKIEAVLATIEK